MKTKRRAGMAIILILVALAVLTIVLSVATSQALAQRRLAQQRARQLQADWLARAGIELAAARLLGQPGAFTTEHKDLAPDALVRVVVEKTGDNVFDVRAETEIKSGDAIAVIRSARVRFRRSDIGAPRLQALPSEQKN